MNAEQARVQPGKGEYRNRRLLEDLLGHLEACIAVMQGRDLRYIFVNRAYRALRPEVEMIGRTYHDVFPEAAALGAEEEMLRAIDTGEPVVARGYHAPIAGKPDAAWDHQIIRLPSEPGEEPSVLVATWDVTMHERTVEALRKSEERLQSSEATLRLATEATGLGIFDFYPLTGELRWSDVAKQHFGLPPDAPVDYDVFLSGLHPEDRERVHHIVQNVLRPESGGTYKTEYRTVGIVDGKERWLSAQGIVFFDPDGQPLRFIGTTVDITQRKRADDELKRALREAEEGRRILEAMMAHIPMGITIADAPDVTIRAVSRYGRELTGKSRERIEGIPVELHTERWDIYRADTVTRARNEDLPLTRATRNGEIVLEEEWVLGRGDGVRIPILCTAAPIRDQSGRITGGVIGWQDITERKAAEAERERLIADLKRSNRELRQFAYVSSHDLQEPLRAVANYAELLASRYKGKLDQRGELYLGFLVEGAHRMFSLINDFLAFSRVDTRARPFRPVDMNIVLDRAMVKLKSEIERSRADITLDRLPAVVGDETQMEEVFTHLVGNAIKFRKETVPPRIRVSAERVGNEAVFVVHDNGIGMEPIFFEKIFVIFQRLHPREEYSGTGIGLAICRKIVEHHGGRIWVESTPGEGSSFYFSIPDLNRQARRVNR